MDYGDLEQRLFVGELADRLAALSGAVLALLQEQLSAVQKQGADSRKLAQLVASAVTSLLVREPLASSGNGANVVIELPLGSVGNAYLANSKIKLVAGPGLTGGGEGELGGTLTLALPSLGPNGTIAYPTSLTVDEQGRVTAATAGSAPPAAVLDLTVQSPLSDVGTPQHPNLTLPDGTIANAKLVNSSLTVTAGAGLSGGGAVALGGSVAVAMPNVGPNATIPYPSSITFDAQGRATAATAGSAPPASVLSVTVQPPLSDVGTPQNPNLTLPNGSIGNTKLANSSLTVTAGAGLSGGGAVALGGSVAVAMPNVGPNATIPYPASITFDAQGRATAATAGSAPPAAVLSVMVQPPLSDVGTAQNPNLTLPNGSIGNAKLANSSLTVTAGAGLSGGGAVALGGSVAVAMPNVGPNATIAYPASITLDAQGRVSSAIAGSAPPPTANVQLFLAPGTFTKPVGAYQWADLFLIGPGGPGGSGRRSNGARSGGGGGGAGAYTPMRLPFSDLPASVSVTPGTVGIPGIAIAADSTNGQAGTSSSAAIFGTIAQADGGQGGAGGTSTTATGGAGGLGIFPGGQGGTGTTTFGLTPTAAAHAGGGGGGGGGINAGGNGGTRSSAQLLGGFGGAIGANGAAGNAGTGPTPGSGGGGGGGGTVGPGGTGGAGGGFGAGGGGGGSSPNGRLSGAGGVPSPGMVLVICS
ncbi:MAG TPA: hypothetical protein PKI03_07790 [Pseudomonadota bacterium]|nr:hypothetical protein [Pseudomonadota bacterium]